MRRWFAIRRNIRLLNKITKLSRSLHSYVIFAKLVISRRNAVIYQPHCGMVCLQNRLHVAFSQISEYQPMDLQRLESYFLQFTVPSTACRVTSGRITYSPFLFLFLFFSFSFLHQFKTPVTKSQVTSGNTDTILNYTFKKHIL